MNPMEIFKIWFELAKEKELEYPEAMTLATCSQDMMPHVRVVLMKSYSEEGFIFYTNLTSNKAQDLDKNPQASLCFHWKTLKRQVRVEGQVKKVSDEQANEYFASRPRLSQIGAWASKQSQPMKNSLDLMKAVAKYTAQFNISNIPRPDFWSGFLVIPDKIEFWEEKSFRLHERKLYIKQNGQWLEQQLYP